MAGRGSKPGERRGGRRKGAPNKVTADVRVAVGAFAQGQSAEFERWVTQTAKGMRQGKKWVIKPDPGRAADIYLRAIEYHIPKLSRTELAGDAGKPIVVNIKRFGDGA